MAYVLIDENGDSACGGVIDEKYQTRPEIFGGVPFHSEGGTMRRVSPSKQQKIPQITNCFYLFEVNRTRVGFGA